MTADEIAELHTAAQEAWDNLVASTLPREEGGSVHPQMKAIQEARRPGGLEFTVNSAAREVTFPHWYLSAGEPETFTYEELLSGEAVLDASDSPYAYWRYTEHALAVALACKAIKALEMGGKEV